MDTKAFYETKLRHLDELIVALTTAATKMSHLSQLEAIAVDPEPGELDTVLTTIEEALTGARGLRDAVGPLAGR